MENCHLVEDVPDISLGLSEPHCEQFRTLDGDEVRLTLVGDCLSQKRLTAARRTVEQHTCKLAA